MTEAPGGPARGLGEGHSPAAEKEERTGESGGTGIKLGDRK